MIVSVDFIPPRRRELRRVRARTRAWGVAGFVLALVLAGAYGVLLVQGDDPAAGVGEELVRVKAEIEREKSVRAGLDMEIARAEGELAQARMIGQHPDWSVLLNLLARERGEDVVLTKVVVRPAEKGGASGKGAPGVRAESFVVRVTGQARTQPAALKFALRLEGLELFDTVGSVQTKPVDVRGREFFGFDVECAIGPRAVPAGAGAGGKSP